MNKKTIPSSVVSSFFLLVLLPPPVNDPVRQPQRPTTTTTTKTKDKRLSLSLSLRCGSMDRPLSLWPPHWRHGRPENEDRSRAAMLRFSFVFFCFHFCFVFALVRGRLDAALMSSNRAAKSPQTNHRIRVHLFFFLDSISFRRSSRERYRPSFVSTVLLLFFFLTKNGNEMAAIQVLHSFGAVTQSKAEHFSALILDT